MNAAFALSLPMEADFRQYAHPRHGDKIISSWTNPVILNTWSMQMMVEQM